jgi:hypothetical protein
MAAGLKAFPRIGVGGLLPVRLHVRVAIAAERSWGLELFISQEALRREGRVFPRGLLHVDGVTVYATRHPEKDQGD